MKYELSNELKSTINDLINNYEKPVEIMEGVTFSLKDTIKRIFFYSMSTYLSSSKDSYGRRKPFQNIVNEHVDGEVTNTDPDFKKLQLKAENQNYALTLLLRKKLVEWAKLTNFSQTLNDLNEVFVRYGGVMVKKRMEKGKLIIEPVQWKDLVVDQVDIESGAIMEKHFLSPQELRQKENVWHNVNDAIALANKDDGNNTDRVEILEIEGEFPLSNLIDGAVGYSLMRIIVATDDHDMVLLDKFEVKESQYKYLARKRNLTTGRALGMGVVEEGFEAQISVNEAAIAERLSFELGGKVVAKTNNKTIAQQPLTSVEDGTVFELDTGEFFDSMSLLPSNVPEYSNLIAKWEENYRRQTGVQSTTDVAKSGTPFRSLALQTKRGSSKSDYRRQGFDFLVKEIIQDWVLLELAKEINRDHFDETQYSDQELKAIDEAFTKPHVINSVNNAVAQSISQGVVSPIQPSDLVNEQMDLIQKSNRRNIHFEKNTFKDLIRKVTVLFDDEFVDRQAQMQTLFDMWNAMAPDDPNRQTVWNEMVELGGAMSPASMIAKSAPAPAPAQGGTAQQSASPSAISKDINGLLPKATQNG